MAEIAVIILAAGKSSRFSQGSAKLVADFDSKPLVRWAVDAAVASRANPIIVVTGYAREQIEAAIGDARVVFVHNEDYATGLASSLRAGLASLPREAAGAVICLADMPKVTSSLIDRLIARFARARGEAHAIVPIHEGRRGNPALIARGLFKRIATLEGDEGDRRILREPTTKVIELPVEDAGILVDIDAPEDLRKLLRHSRVDHGSD
jgi:molybdenum cofactor cytidylyltransferase